MIKVTVRPVRKLGLEVWQVLVGESIDSEFLAEYKAREREAKLNKSLQGVKKNAERT